MRKYSFLRQILAEAPQESHIIMQKFIEGEEWCINIVDDDKTAEDFEKKKKHGECRQRGVGMEICVWLDGNQT